MKNFLIALVAVIIILGGVWFFTKENTEIDFPEEEDVELEEMEEEDLMNILGNVEGISSIKYDIRMDSPETTMEGTFWQKGEKIKLEGTVEGEEMVVIVDNVAKNVRVYLPSEDMATEVPFSEAEEAQSGSMKEKSMELPDHNPVVVGSEVINGMDCIVVEYTDEEERTGKMWIWKDHGIPVKVEVEETVIIAENIDFSTISEATFELPDGVELMEMPSF